MAVLLGAVKSKKSKTAIKNEFLALRRKFKAGRLTKQGYLDSYYSLGKKYDMELFYPL